jgi:hypothetical protein
LKTNYIITRSTLFAAVISASGNHSLDSKSNEALDYTIRIQQFFDHYLKDSACPRWMLYGIPAKLKGTDNGYELVREKAALKTSRQKAIVME